jgi:sodium-coupled monocarboxylate transporter 8/12
MAALLKGGILEAALSINGIVGGATFAIFFLGVFVPFQDSIGASVGLISGVGISTWMYIENG